jgi:hypothetical protein
MLEPVPGGENHQVACLLDSEQRRALWAQLRAGETPAEAIAAVDLPQQPQAPEPAQEPETPEAPL